MLNPPVSLVKTSISRCFVAPELAGVLPIGLGAKRRSPSRFGAFAPRLGGGGDGESYNPGLPWVVTRQPWVFHGFTMGSSWVLSWAYVQNDSKWSVVAQRWLVFSENSTLFVG